MENLENTSLNKPLRDELGRLLPGQTANPNGRPEMTEEEKVKAKAQRDIIKEYKESLKQALPLISPVLIAKAMEGDMSAIKEVNDRVMGKSEAKTDVTSNGETITSVINIIKPDASNNV